LIFLLGGDRAGGKGVCGRIMSHTHETQSMREIRLLRGRLPRKGGGLTGMDIRDGNEYIIRKWLDLKFHGSGHLPNHTTSK
jgi:hypothetical protein